MKKLILILMIMASTAFARTQEEINTEVETKLAKEEKLQSDTMAAVSEAFLKVDAALEYERTMDLPISYDRGPKMEKLEALRKALLQYLVWPNQPE